MINNLILKNKIKKAIIKEKIPDEIKITL